MTFDQFITKFTGVFVDTDLAYGAQCMDLVHKYCQDVLGLSDLSILAAPAAYQVYTGFRWPQYFDKIANTPNGVPQKGDILIYGTGMGAWGHICIFVSGDVWNITSFDQNYPLGSSPHLQRHDYRYILGWLHPKQAPTTPSVPSSTCSDYMKQIKTITYGTNTTANKLEQIKGIFKSAGYV